MEDKRLPPCKHKELSEAEKEGVEAIIAKYKERTRFNNNFKTVEDVIERLFGMVPPPKSKQADDFVPDQERLRKLASTAPSKIGGKGTIRRRAKRTHHHHHQGGVDDERKLQATYKRLAMNTVSGIEEVNFFKTNGEVMHFTSPKVQASIGSNTFAITGPYQSQEIGKMLPGIVSQLGADLFTRKFANVVPEVAVEAQSSAVAAETEDIADEIPELVSADFEEASMA
ncbi:hypothetical protein ACOME3_007130 [Neoechinorhynchus agilis]